MASIIFNIKNYATKINVILCFKVLEPLTKTDKETKGIQDFNKMINNDSCVEKVMLSIRDGLYLIRKK